MVSKADEVERACGLCGVELYPGERGFDRGLCREHLFEHNAQLQRQLRIHNPEPLPTFVPVCDPLTFQA